MIQKSVRRVKRAYQRYGMWKLFLLSINMVPRVYRNHRAVGLRERKQREFDSKYGVDTGGITDLSAFSIKYASWVWGARYGPSSEAFVIAVLQSLDLNYRQFSFVDYGSGKGAVLLYASRFPFQEIIGIEFAHELHDIALANLQQFNQAGVSFETPIHPICADATTFDVPLTPLILYFLAPFGPPVLEKVLARIESSFGLNPREIYIIYGYPQYIWDSDSILASQPFLKKVREAVLESVPCVVYQAILPRENHN